MGLTSFEEARSILTALPLDIETLQIVCPLCGHDMPARGLRIRLRRGLEDTHWQLLFSCPACGLLTAFDADPDTAARIAATSGSPWAAQLRQAPRSERLASFELRTTFSQYIARCLTGLVVWILLIGNLNPLEALWGATVSATFLPDSSRLRLIPRNLWNKMLSTVSKGFFCC